MRKRSHPATVRQVYSERLGRIRRGRDWTQQRLADEMARIAFPIGRATIAKIEAGQVANWRFPSSSRSRRR